MVYDFIMMEVKICGIVYLQSLILISYIFAHLSHFHVLDIKQILNV